MIIFCFFLMKSNRCSTKQTDQTNVLNLWIDDDGEDDDEEEEECEQTMTTNDHFVSLNNSLKMISILRQR